ncbi:MAG TPA: type II CAAX endopeptidase family protein [Gemmatimonadales bacterium]|nr:type II CAAX endopeptidase family protein [Gemmatimonadales bacterium]
MPDGFRFMAQHRPLLLFAILAIILGWVVALPLVLSPAGFGIIQTQMPELWLVLVCFTPTIAAMWTQYLSEGSFRIARIGSPWPKVLLGCVLGPILTILAFIVVPGLVLTNGALTLVHWTALASASLPWWSNPFNLLGGPLNEEPGWRGYALPRCQERFGALGGSLVLGVVWALWHVPLFLLQGYLTVPVWAFVFLLICLSVLMTWVYNISSGSVITAVLMHAAFNSSFPVLIALDQGIPTREPALPWYLAAVGSVTLLAVVVTRGRLGRRRRSSPAAPPLIVVHSLASGSKRD